MANAVFNYFKTAVMQGSYNLASFPIYCALVNNSYAAAVDVDNHKYWGQIDGTYEISGTAYVAGGAALSNPAVTQDDTDNEGVFDADDCIWGTSTITAAGAIIYGSSGLGADSDPMVCFIDFTEDKSSVTGKFTIQWNAEGILNIT